MAVLIHMPSVPDLSKQRMLDELVSFGRAVKARARRAREFANDAAATERPHLRARFQDVLDRVDQDE